ncbi:MAG TPA: hypothetical protein VFK69_06865, partial [Candidatus Eisenbacteria bacterium]|nr:hypothetical protein [Candidatus Eisenbacteria bacterium]
AALHIEFSGALAAAAVHVQPRAGRLAALIPASDRRVALLRESLAELDAAGALATTPAERALVMAHRANRLVIWGFPWDALVEFRRAQALDPQWRPIADELADWLRHPERESRPDSLLR